MTTESTTDPAKLPRPAIVYGTAWKKQRTAELVELALRTGFRAIDTACQPKHYNEAGVGLGIKSCLEDTSLNLRREDLYLQTKYTPVDGQDRNTIPYDPSTDFGTQLAQSVATSLTNLQTTYVDCLLLHSPMQPWPKTLEVWSAMEAQIEAERVHTIGISNCYRLEQLRDLYSQARIKPTVLQNRFYAESGYDRELRTFCQANNIVYQSFWTLTANPDLLSQPKVRALASAYQASPAQILFRYLTQIGVVPLTGTSSINHMRDDAEIFRFELSPEQCQDITALIDTMAATR